MKKVYVQAHEQVGGAGQWIYQGYKNAWNYPDMKHNTYMEDQKSGMS